MSPLIFLITVLAASQTTGDGDVETHIPAAIGSSVLFPGVKFDKYTMYELSRGKEHVVVTCYGGCTVMDSYTKRGHFYHQNGTFVMNELRASDSGTFELKINFTVKAKIHLHVIAPVTKLILLVNEESGNGSQCPTVFTCQAEGDSPLNFTFLRNDDEILHNEVSTDNSVSMDAPTSGGRFSCNVANPVSSNTSTTINLLHPATLMQQITRLIAIASLIHWIFVVCILCKKHISTWLAEQKWKGNDKNDKVDQDSRNPSKDNKACTPKIVFYVVDNLLGSLKETALVVTCVVGGFIPAWWSVGPGVLLLCRLIFQIFAFINWIEETRAKLPSVVKVICDVGMAASNLFVIPAYSIAILVKFSMLYRLPCGTTDKYPILLSFCVVLFILYLVMKKFQTKEKKKTEGTEDPPEKQQLVKDNRNPNCNGATVDGDTQNQRDVLAMEGPEDPMIPKPEEGQPTEVNQCPKTAAPNQMNSDGTKNQDGRCVPTLEKEEAGNG